MRYDRKDRLSRAAGFLAAAALGVGLGVGLAAIGGSAHQLVALFSS